MIIEAIVIPSYLDSRQSDRKCRYCPLPFQSIDGWMTKKLPFNMTILNRKLYSHTFTTAFQKQILYYILQSLSLKQHVDFNER